MSDVKLDDIVSLCKRRGFIFQGSEIYGGLAGTWDYGPLGVALKRNITNLWWKMFVEERDDMYGVDAAILMNQKTWKASGHVDTFTDPMVECMSCHGRFRADQIDLTAACTSCGAKGKFSEPEQFNMMLKTVVGPKYSSWDRKEAGGLEGEIYFKNKAGEREKLWKIEDSDNELGGVMLYDSSAVSYLRPETAQGIFTNFKNVVDSLQPDLPFGIAQQGKAFRNEISPRDFVFRSREFEQMEIEYFVHPDNWEQEFEKWVKLVHEWCKAIGLPEGSVHELEVPDEDRAHYSKRTIDFEFDYPIGRKELLGLAYRTDFDLSQHEEHSKKNLKYVPKDGGKPFVPHVIEPSFGVERAIMAVLVSAYKEDEQNGEKRIYLALPPHLAPVRVAVLPLAKNKPELVAKAREVYAMLKKEFGNVMWVDTGNIGKNYRKMDEIGVPQCVTVDFQTLEDSTVTVRDRDTTEQDRIDISNIALKLKI